MPGESRLCGPNAGEFHFEAAEVGVKILADAVGDIDARSLSEFQGGQFFGHMPTKGADSAGAIMRQFETKVALFHDAWCGDETRIAGHEDGLGIAVAQGLELAEPSGENGGDVVKRQLGVDMQVALGRAIGKALGSALGKAALEFGEEFGGKGKADGKGVSAETREEVGARLDCGEQVELVDGAT